MSHNTHIVVYDGPEYRKGWGLINKIADIAVGCLLFVVMLLTLLIVVPVVALALLLLLCVALPLSPTVAARVLFVLGSLVFCWVVWAAITYTALHVIF